jgi:hypothetical protein
MQIALMALIPFLLQWLIHNNSIPRAAYLSSKEKHAANILEKKGLSVRVIDMDTVKPIDDDRLDSVFAKKSWLLGLRSTIYSPDLVLEWQNAEQDLQWHQKLFMRSFEDNFKKIGNYESKWKTLGLLARISMKKVERCLALRKCFHNKVCKYVSLPKCSELIRDVWLFLLVQE